MKVVFGCDHAAVALKDQLLAEMREAGYDCADLGVAAGETCDYPDMAKTLAEKVAAGEYDRGVLLCGTGIGMSIAANKVPGIRAALVTDCFGAKYTRLHNDANVCCLGARTTGPGLALELLRIFLETPFEGGRHARRVEKITQMEQR